jgi:hypothetical protein
MKIVCGDPICLVCFTPNKRLGPTARCRALASLTARHPGAGPPYTWA